MMQPTDCNKFNKKKCPIETISIHLEGRINNYQSQMEGGTRMREGRGRRHAGQDQE